MKKKRKRQEVGTMAVAEVAEAVGDLEVANSRDVAAD